LEEGKEEGKGGRKGAGWDGRSPKTKSWLRHCIASIKFIIFDSFALNSFSTPFVAVVMAVSFGTCKPLP
jgi:hypothetical protein